MGYGRQIIYFFFFSNLHLALTVLTLVNGTGWFYGTEPLPALCQWALFTGTWALYLQHYMYRPLDDFDENFTVRQAWYHRNRRWLRPLGIALWVICLVAVIEVVLKYYDEIPIEFWLSGLFVGAFSFIYSYSPFGKPLGKIGWLKSTLVGLAWAVVTVHFPLAWQEDQVLFTESYWAIMASRFFFVGSLAFVFDWRDQAHDARDGVRTLAVTHPKAYLKFGVPTALAISFLAALLVASIWPMPLTWWAVVGPTILAAPITRRLLEWDEPLPYLIAGDGLMFLQGILLQTGDILINQLNLF